MSDFPHRFTFEWRRPTFDVLHAAHRHWGFVLNRYPGALIGIAFFVGHRGVGFRWGRPGRTINGIRPMTDQTVGTCDWGDCDELTIAERRDFETDQWLGVCRQHSGLGAGAAEDVVRRYGDAT